MEALDQAEPCRKCPSRTRLYHCMTCLTAQSGESAVKKVSAELCYPGTLHGGCESQATALRQTNGEQFDRAMVGCEGAAMIGEDWFEVVVGPSCVVDIVSHCDVTGAAAA